MSLEYTKRLLELRDYATDVLTEKTSEKNKSNSLVSRPNNEEEEEENPIDEVQKNAFLEVVMSNLELKEKLDDSV